MTHRSVAIALLTLCTLTPVDLSAAPGDPPFDFVVVSTRVARLGQQGQIETYYRKLREAEANIGIEGLTEIYMVVQGGRAQTFVSIRTMKEWHELDTDAAERSLDALTRTFGAQEAERLGQAMASASESVTNEILQVARGLSNWQRSPSGRPWPYMQVRRNAVKPGMQQQYAQFAAKMREVRMKASAAPELRWSVVEGPSGVFGTTRYFRGWQDRALWDDELAAVLADDEGANWRAAFDSSIERTETFVLRHRADLSRRAAPARASQ
jgi:hypothetical protein